VFKKFLQSETIKELKTIV